MERAGKWFLFITLVGCTILQLWRSLHLLMQAPFRDLSQNLITLGGLVVCSIALYVFGRDLGVFSQRAKKTVNRAVWRLRQDRLGNYRRYVLVVVESQDKHGRACLSRWFETPDGKTLETEPDDEDARALLRTFEYNKNLG